MILELIGSRILAPYLGTSIFVWASIIGVILGAMTLGYYFGGKFSEHNPTINFLAKILFLSGTAILIVGLIKEPILMLSVSLGIKTGSVVATLILFALPTFLLGMVSPYAIRLKIINVETSGEVAGNLYALSTVGSIFGTFLAGFYLIPTFGSSQIIFGLGCVLILTSIFGHHYRRLKVLLLFIIILLFFTIDNTTNGKYLYQGDSEYNHIKVADFKDSGRPIRVLFLSTYAHSIVYRDSNDVYSEYMKLYHLDTLFNPQIKNALTLGGGAYIGPVDFIKRHPQSKITVVEIDPKVTEVARIFFGLTDSDNLKIIHEDGRIFLNNNQEKFDVVYGDAYASFYSIPFQLTTNEAIKKVASSLSDDGFFVLNLISGLTGEKSKFFQAELKTLKENFAQVLVFQANQSKDINYQDPQNIVLFAFKKPVDLAKLANQADLEQKGLLKKYLSMDFLADNNIKILTDELAPVDNYISKLIE